MSTWPLASWAGLRRTCTAVQVSRGRVAPADLRSNHHRRPSARRAGGHLREETHPLAEWPRLDLEEGAFGLRARPLKAGPSRVPHSGERSSEQFPPRCRRTVSLFCRTVSLEDPDRRKYVSLGIFDPARCRR